MRVRYHYLVFQYEIHLTHLSKIEGVIRSLKGLPVLIQLNLIHNFILGFIERE